MLKKVSKDLRKLMLLSHKISDGDLSKSSDSFNAKDEMGILHKEFDNMRKKLSDIIKLITSSYSSINSAISNISYINSESEKADKEILETVKSTADYADEERNLIKDSVDSITGINNLIIQVFDQAKSAINCADEAFTKATDGVEMVNNIVVKTENVNTQVSELNNFADELFTKSQKIGDIIKIINDISEETNLLSLNASIEAARAGESGKGFAVVAEQVKKLADQSRNSSNSISAIIIDVQNQIQEIREKTRSSLEFIGVVNDSVINEKTAFKEIINKNDQVNKEIISINTSLENVRSNLKNINETNMTLLSLSQEFTEAAAQSLACMEEQAASKSEIGNALKKLNELSKNFEGVVNNFRT